MRAECVHRVRWRQNDFVTEQRQSILRKDGIAICPLGSDGGQHLSPPIFHNASPRLFALFLISWPIFLAVSSTHARHHRHRLTFACCHQVSRAAYRLFSPFRFASYDNFIILSDDTPGALTTHLAKTYPGASQVGFKIR